MNNYEKPWYASKGVIGSVLVMVLSIIAFFNGILPEDSQVPAEIVDQLKDEKFAEALIVIGTFLSGLLALVGRLVAKKNIGKRLL